MNRLIDAIQKPGPRDLDCDRSDPNVGVFHAQVCFQMLTTLTCTNSRNVDFQGSCCRGVQI